MSGALQGAVETGAELGLFLEASRYGRSRGVNVFFWVMIGLSLLLLIVAFIYYLATGK